MTSDRRDDLIDEAVLRRSLRLESDERVPRFDADAIAALARPTLQPALVLGALVLAIAIGLTASAVWSVAIADGPSLAGEGVALLLDGLAMAASLLYPAVQAATDPAVPLSLLAALGVAILHEMRTRRERVHVHTS